MYRVWVTEIPKCGEALIVSSALYMGCVAARGTIDIENL